MAAAPAFDVVLGSPSDLPDVIESLALKGFCVIDASVCGKLASDALSEVKDIPKARFSAPPSAEGVRVADGLLGADGSARIAELLPPGAKQANGAKLNELDEFCTELSIGLGEYLPLLGTDVSTRSAGLIHESVKAESSDATLDLDEIECSKWLRIFTRHRLMILVFLGPAEGTLELGLFGEESTETHTVVTGPNVMVILRADAVSRKHHAASGKAHVYSCFVTTTRDAPKPTEPPFPPHREALIQWSLARLKELKDLEDDDPAVAGVPKPWARAMNALFHRGQQACVRGDSCKLAGPVGWEPEGFTCQMMLGADTVSEIPHSRFVVDDWYYADPKDELWQEYKTYSRHGSFVDGASLFDNKHFGISNNEASGYPISSKWGLECGYEAIFKAGWNKKSIQRKKADVFYGLHSTENQLNNKTEHASCFSGSAGSQAGEPNRVSFCLNMMGQSICYDTDGSSSFSALWQGQMEQSDDDPNGRNSMFSLILGSAWNITPAAFANFCSRRLLTTEGRCFSFDQKATGFVRAESCGAVVLAPLYQMVQDMPVIEDTGLGIVRSVELMQCGKGVTLAAPSGTCMQEVMTLCVRSGAIQLEDIDAVECHAAGTLLVDAVEASSIAKCLAEGIDDAALALTDAKTAYGSGYAAAGIVSLVAVLQAATKAVITANNMLRQLNPYIDADDRPIFYATEPVDHPLSATGFTHINSFGNSGTYVSASVWGDLQKSVRAEEEREDPPAPLVTFWPGGGGELDSEAQPQDGYYIVGSFSQWAKPQKMVEEVPGIWSATIALGENRWEQFQIWLDADASRVLHPGQSKASRNQPVAGPEPSESCSGCTWQIDGRPTRLSMSMLGSLPREDLGVIGSLPNRDQGGLGDLYRVRLCVAGKYRTVTWDRVVDNVAAEREKLAPPAGASYYVAASWNDWEMEEMTHDAREGLWRADVVHTETRGEFAIIRNRDWGQKLYPASREPEISDGPVSGPDDEGEGANFVLDGPGAYSIEFRRVVENEDDHRAVCWRLRK